MIGFHFVSNDGFDTGDMASYADVVKQLNVKSNLLDGKNEANDETVESQSLSENEDQNHTDEETGLLSVGANTSVTNDTDGHTGSETGETDRETSTEVGETLERSVLGSIDWKVPKKTGGA